MDDRAAEIHARSAGVEALPAAAAGSGPVRLRGSRGKKWSAPLRWLTIALSITGGLGICALLAGAVFVARLEKGPIPVAGLGQRIADQLQLRFGGGHTFRLGETMIEKGPNGPELTIEGLSISGRDGDIILAAPKARVSLDPFALVVGDVTPKRLDVVGLELRMSVMPDGGFAVSAGKTPILLTPGKPDKGAPATSAPAAVEAATTGEPATAEAGPSPAIAPSSPTARDAMRPAADALRELLSLATGKGSPLGGLGQFGIVDGKLVFEDRTSGKETVFDGLQMQLERSDASARLLVSVNGPNGRWQLSVGAGGEVDRAAGEARTLDVEFSDLSLDEITLFAGLRDLPFDLDSRMRVKFRIGAGEDGEFRMARGQFGLGQGYLAFRDPDQEPFPVDRLSGSFHWDDTARRFVIEPTQIDSGSSNFLIGGEILPPADGAKSWAINLASIGDAQIGPERPGETALAIGKFEFRATLDPHTKTLEVGRFALNGPEVRFESTASFAVFEEGRRFKFAGAIDRMPARAIMRLWPSVSGAQVRQWLLLNLKSGNVNRATLSLDYGEEAFAAIRARRALPEEAVRLEFDMQDAVLSYLPGVSPARGISGVGLVTGKHSQFTLARGHVDAGGRQLVIGGGSFKATNMAPELSPASVTVNLSGGVETLASILGEPGLKQHAALVLDPGTLKGRFEGKLTVDFRLGPKASGADVRVRAQAQASNVSIDHLLGKEKLENANIQFTVDGKDMSASGVGRMFGAPATLSFEKGAKSDIQGVISVLLDDQARQKLGWSTGARLTGPVSMKVSGALGGQNLQGNVEFDLTRAALADIMPGLGKPAGRPARASFTLVHRGEGSTLQGFNYQAGSVSARGTIELDKRGAFTSANLSSLKLSPGDDMSGTISAGGGNLQVTLAGAAMDMRSFIQAMTSSRVTSGEDSASDPAGRLELDMQARLATGYNRQALADFSMKMNRQGGRFQRFELSARTGRSPVRGRLVPGTTRVEVTAGDGGAAMAFLDLYKRMEGGQLSLSAEVSSNRVDGILNVQNFVLRDEPAMRRLVAEGVPRADQDGRVRIDPALVNFDRLRLNFSKAGGRIQLHDGVINGPTIGTTLEGMVDFPRDQVNMKGTFVPAYGLNNMFAKIPLFGPILGGGRNEGLVGVNFSVTGRASAPVLNVNPLSAIAPGFLRKIFGAIGSVDAPPPDVPRPQMPLSLTPARRQ